MLQKPSEGRRELWRRRGVSLRDGDDFALGIMACVYICSKGDDILVPGSVHAEGTCDMTILCTGF